MAFTPAATAAAHLELSAGLTIASLSSKKTYRRSSSSLGFHHVAAKERNCHQGVGRVTSCELFQGSPRKSDSPKSSDSPTSTGRAVTAAGAIAEREAAAVEVSDSYPGLAAWNSVKQEQWEGELEVQGSIPQWLAGTYLRNGPGLFNIADKEAHHLFDGFSTLLRLKFEGGKLIASHNQLRSDAYNAAQKFQRVAYQEFSAPPEKNLLARLGNLAGMVAGSSLTDNANTGVIKLGDGRVLCLTETVKGAHQIDPNTLETMGRFKWEDNLGGIIHSAHPYVDSNELITLIPDLFHSGYSVARMRAGSNTRELIGKVKCRGPTPGWVHSFAVTENYVVIPEMPLRYSIKNLLQSEPCEYFKFEWMPETGGYMHIMNRHTGEVVTCVEVPNFVTFHFINAYEETGEDGVVRVIADCCEHTANPIILQNMTLSSLRSPAGVDNLPDARVGRFTVPLDGSPAGTLEAAVPPEEHGRGLDMNTINFKYASKKYRYVYACGAHRPAHFPNNLTKIDLDEKSAKNFYHDGGIPTEPFFVPRPGAVTEDDGVVVSVVSDSVGGGFVILLDGATFTEIARADLPYGLPYGLHGCWVPSTAAAVPQS
ncbi:hypothetical protein Mapa_008024 [Marchantia paleacea]|nr:hypothetical protein Mapa_008024 [Marchantia paleacea]